MSRGESTSGTRQIALALTWDGARWPRSKLPQAARAFLRAGENVGTRLPSPRALARLFQQDLVAEIRICWVPCLLGGEPALALPFTTEDGRRRRFELVTQVALGDHLGTVYHRLKPSTGEIPQVAPPVPKDRRPAQTGPKRKGTSSG